MGSRRVRTCDGTREHLPVQRQVHRLPGRHGVPAHSEGRPHRDRRLGRDLGTCTRRINLRGHTVIPGLVDSHAHFSRTGTNPGYEPAGWRRSSRSPSSSRRWRSNRDHPGGRVRDRRGRLEPEPAAEARLPTLAELDAAISTRAATSTGTHEHARRGALRRLRITIDPVTGQVSNAGAATTAPLDPPSRTRRAAPPTRSRSQPLTGPTSIHDTSNLTIQPEDCKGMNLLDEQSGRSLDVRMRHYRHSADGDDRPAPTYMDPIYREVGDETYRINGVGEQIGNGDQFMDNLRVVAEACMARQQQHAHGDRPRATTSWYMHGRGGVRHRSAAVVARAPPARDRGGHPGAQGRWRWRDPAGLAVPELQRRAALPSDLRQRDPIGAGTDPTKSASAQPVARALLHVHGPEPRRCRNECSPGRSRGSRRRDVHRRKRVFSEEENELGSFEVGKKCDLAVLSDDYLKVSDENLRKVTSSSSPSREEGSSTQPARSRTWLEAAGRPGPGRSPRRALSSCAAGAAR